MQVPVAVKVNKRRIPMAYNGFAIDKYPDVEEIIRKLDALRDGPIYSILPEYLAEYEDQYFNKKCLKSKEMIDEAKTVIPGGV